MSYLLFAITERELDAETIDNFDKENISIKDYSPYIKDGRIGHFYYEISNEISTTQPSVNPYNKIEEMHSIIKSMHEKGNFRLVTIDSNNNALIKKDKMLSFEEAVEEFPQEKIKLQEALERYPQHIDTNRIYIVD